MKGTVKVLRKDGNHGRGHSVIRGLDTAGQWFRRKSCKSLNVVNHPTERLYESDVYRCYRKVSSRQSCQGPSSYAMEPLNEAVEKEIREFFTNLGCVPADQLVANACDRKATEAQVEQLLTWAEKYDEASYEAKHLIIAALVDRVEVNKNYEVKVFFKVSAEQFLDRVVRIA